MSISVRPCQASDADFVLSLVGRFSEFSLPGWRPAADLDRLNRATLQKALELREAGADSFVAEVAGQLAGFIHLQTQVDYFTGEACGYIADVAVDQAFEGQGVGGRLLAQAEEWCSAKGYRLLTLYLFAGNARAQRLYETHGFQQEVIKYVKPV